MRKRSFIGGSSRVLPLVALVAACDQPVSKSPTGPSAPAVLAIEIIGPDTIAPGQSAQYTAIIQLADGTKDAASSATNVRWGTSNLLLLRADASGRATALDRLGETAVFAEVGPVGSGTRRGTKDIVIVPEGTFRLVGRVVDGEFPSTPLSGARVEVTPGSLLATTDLDGRYRLYGVPADAVVRVTMDGYQPVEQSVHLTSHATQDFPLPLFGSRLQLTGPVHARD